MKTLKTSARDFGQLQFKVEHGRQDLRFGILGYSLDFEVYLPTKGFNLQREFCWTLEQKRALIETVLLRRSMPPIVFNQTHYGTEKDFREIIDGKQRLSSIIDFTEDKFTIILEDQEWLYSELPKDYQGLIWRYPIDTSYAFDLSDAEKIQWFITLNFAGTPQDEQYLERLKNV